MTGKPSAPELRPAVIADVPAIRACVAAAYAFHADRMGTPPGPMLDDYDAVVADCDVTVAVDDGRLAGVVVVKPHEGGLLLDNVAVNPDWQGTGLGRRLIDHAEATVRAAGHDAIALYTHESMVENIALYERLGYVETHRVTEHGFARVYMRKPLA